MEGTAKERRRRTARAAGEASIFDVDQKSIRGLLWRFEDCRFEDMVRVSQICEVGGIVPGTSMKPTRE